MTRDASLHRQECTSLRDHVEIKEKSYAKWVYTRHQVNRGDGSKDTIIPNKLQMLLCIIKCKIYKKGTFIDARLNCKARCAVRWPSRKTLDENRCRRK